jgi:hypothetical protein
MLLTTTARIAIAAILPMLEALILTGPFIRSSGPTGRRNLSRPWLFSAAGAPTIELRPATRVNSFLHASKPCAELTRNFHFQS